MIQALKYSAAEALIINKVYILGKLCISFGHCVRLREQDQKIEDESAVLLKDTVTIKCYHLMNSYHTAILCIL